MKQNTISPTLPWNWNQMPPQDFLVWQWLFTIYRKFPENPVEK